MAVYFIRTDDDSGSVKIGYTSGCVRRRLHSLQIGSLQKLRIVCVIQGDRATEKEMHERFRATRRSGEWFGMSIDLLDFFHDHPLPDEFRGRTQSKSALGDWLRANKITPMEFGARIGLKQPNSVYRWLRGELKPSTPNMVAIMRETSGAVTANDFYDLEPA